jgi:hypothetical protein
MQANLASDDGFGGAEMKSVGPTLRGPKPSCEGPRLFLIISESRMWVLHLNV